MNYYPTGPVPVDENPPKKGWGGIKKTGDIDGGSVLIEKDFGYGDPGSGG